jgi:hypothetical protein
VDGDLKQVVKKSGAQRRPGYREESRREEGITMTDGDTEETEVEELFYGSVVVAASILPPPPGGTVHWRGCSHVRFVRC